MSNYDLVIECIEFYSLCKVITLINILYTYNTSIHIDIL